MTLAAYSGQSDSLNSSTEAHGRRGSLRVRFQPSLRYTHPVDFSDQANSVNANTVLFLAVSVIRVSLPPYFTLTAVCGKHGQLLLDFT